MISKIRLPFKIRFEQLFFVVLALIGLALIVGSVWKIILIETFHDHAELAFGTVVGVTQGLIGGSAKITVEFQDSEGMIRRSVLETGSETTSISKGYSHWILYDQNDPSNIKGPRYRILTWIEAVVLFFIGAILVYAYVKEIVNPQPDE